MTIYLPHAIGAKYGVDSVLYKKISGKRVYYRVMEVHFFGYKCKSTHTKFVCKRLNQMTKSYEEIHKRNNDQVS